MAYLRNEGSTGVQFKEVYQGIERDSMAYKLMSSMGWHEGEGLGAQKQGISVHVKAHKKFDTLGVGLKEQAARMQDWTLDMCKFSAVLKGLQEISAPESASDEEQLVKPEKVTKARKQKKRAREDEITAVPAERALSSGNESSKQQQTARHAAMYSRRKQQKMVKGYSATDIAAILGHAPANVAPVPAPSAPTQAAEVQQEGVSKKEKKRKAGQSQKGGVHPVAQPQASVPDRPASAPPLPPPPPAETVRWWSTGFRRGDSMGAGNSSVAAATRTAFSERDQSALYAKAQAVKSQGHKGLGSKSAKLKASQWQGKKVSFDSDEEGDEEMEGNDDKTDDLAGILVGNRDQDTLPGGTVVVWGGRRPEWFSSQTLQKQQAPQPDAQLEPANELTPDNDEDAGKSLSLSKKQRKKCLKVACKMLKNCEGGIKLKEVVDSALQALKVSQQTADAEKLRSKVKTVIKKGEGWSVQGGKLMAAIAVTS